MNETGNEWRLIAETDPRENLPQHPQQTARQDGPLPIESGAVRQAVHGRAQTRCQRHPLLLHPGKCKEEVVIHL